MYANIVATIAIFISIVSVTISFTQLSAVKEQLKMTQLQMRPYVRFRPVFSEKGREQLSVTMLSENLNPIPARVIYSQLKTWVDESTTDAFLYNRTGDILYQHRNGASVLPPIPKALAKEAIAGTVKLAIGTCVVYGTISPTDPRRWEARALYVYVPNQALPSDLPSDEYLNEVEVAPTVDHCDSSTIRAEWLNRRGETREVSPSGSPSN